MLSCQGIRKNYGPVVALRSATVQVSRGEVRAILGGNGSGKSTLAKILAGTVMKDAGTITWNGEPLDTSTPAKAFRSGVAVTFQELSLLGNLTVAENVCFPTLVTRYGTVQKRAMEDRVIDLLKPFDLGHRAGDLVDELSTSEQYLVEYVKALYRRPNVLVLDEITSALYREQVSWLQQSIQELSQQGVTILFVSHRLPEIFAFCHSVTVLRNGESVGTYRTSDVTPERLLDLMTARREAKELSLENVDVDKTVRSETNDLPREQNRRRHRAPESSSLDIRLKAVLEGPSGPMELTARRGEIIGIAGIQGQGQSDFVRHLFGITGSIVLEIDGKQVRISNPRSAVHMGVAFVSGDREREGTFSHHTIRMNASVVGTFVLKHGRMPLDRALDDLHTVYTSMNQRIRELSGGNQQKVVLARWMTTAPKLILADDPTKGVDVLARRDVHESFARLASDGTTILYVSSDEEELVSLHQLYPNMRVLVMYQGKILRELRDEELTLATIIEASIPRGDTNVGSD